MLGRTKSKPRGEEGKNSHGTEESHSFPFAGPLQTPQYEVFDIWTHDLLVYRCYDHYSHLLFTPARRDGACLLSQNWKQEISPECPSLHSVKLCKTPFKNEQNCKNNNNRSCKKINKRPRVINATRKGTRVLGGTIIYSRMLRETAVRPES